MLFSHSHATRALRLAAFPALCTTLLVACAEDPAKDTYKVSAGDSATEKQAEEGDQTITLTGDNTTLNWLGSHVADGDGHEGGFKDITGEATITPASDDAPATLSSLSATIAVNADSMWTDNDDENGEGRLKSHLLNEDFFHASEYPESRFVMTDVREVTDSDVTAPVDDATHMLTGNFTLLGETHAISFPAVVEITEDALTLASEFSFNRSEWGMGYGISNNAIRDAVVITLDIDAER